MIKVKKDTLLILLGCLVLNGCSDNGFLFRSFGEYDQTERKGVYYIGEPYRIKGVLYTPTEDMSYSERGMAAWYTRNDLNKLTTNGEVFDDNLMTAAHKTLPLPSMVRITNLENGNTAIVRVNDRGPDVNNRLIDVSQGTAAALEFRAGGTTMVQVDILPEESRRLKAALMGKDQVPVNTDIYTPVEIVPLGSELPVYQPSESAIPIYGDKSVQETVGDTVLKEEASVTTDDRNISEVRVNNNPVDLVPPELDAVEVPLTGKVPVSRVANDVSIEEDAVSEYKSVQSEKKVEAVQISKDTFDDLSEKWMIQAGAFGNPENIEKNVRILKTIGAVVLVERNGLTAIQIGPFKNRNEAEEILDKVRRAGYPEAQIRKQK